MTDLFLDLELAWLGRPKHDASDDVLKEATSLLQELCRFGVGQNYDSCLQRCFEEISLQCTLDTLPASLEKWLCSDDKQTKRSALLLCCAISCLQLFVQLNWTGPQIKVQDFKSIFNCEIDDLVSNTRELLMKEANPVYHLASAPHYLYFAESALCVLKACDGGLQTVHWWLFRCYNAHSQVISERSESLFTDTKTVLDVALRSEFLKQKECKSLLLQLHLEAGLSLLHFYQYKEANNHFLMAREVAGMEFSFTGALGVRTKFQSKPVSQLQVCVKLDSGCEFSSFIDKCGEDRPKILPLNDDTLLERPKFIDGDDKKIPELVPEQQALLLAACTAMHRASPSSKLQEEEIGAVVEVLLSSPTCRCIGIEALRVRSKNEKDRSRTVERSMAQMENLVSIASEPVNTSKHRLDLFYCVRPPPIWMLQKELACLYMSLGAVSSAYQIYERLEMWEEAIMCLVQSDRGGAATEMIKKQLEVNETPNLWCLLGDMTQEPQHYLRAWELSRQCNARAMRSLGGYYASKKKYTEAVECFQKSLDVLSLQVGTWFTMGCVLMVIKEFEKAARAFKRCVSLDWDNFEAWTNLSTSYVKCYKKNEAFKALSEAIKCNFNKWQLWENYVAISADVGQFNEALSAYNRLLDLKDKFVDIPILKVLVRAVTENIADANEKPGSFLKTKLLKLFGRLTSKASAESGVWELYAELCGNGLLSDKAENEKAVERLHKALRIGMQQASWEKDDALVGENVQVANKLAAACSHCGKDLAAQTLASVRLSVKGLFAKLKQRERSILNVEAQEKFKEHINTVNECVNIITQVANASAPS